MLFKISFSGERRVCSHLKKQQTLLSPEKEIWNMYGLKSIVPNIFDHIAILTACCIVLIYMLPVSFFLHMVLSAHIFLDFFTYILTTNPLIYILSEAADLITLKDMVVIAILDCQSNWNQIVILQSKMFFSFVAKTEK